MNEGVTKYQSGTRKKPIFYLLPFILCLLTLLTGCVDYDVGISFESPYDGTIVQHIHIGEELTNFDKSATKQWLKSIEDRAYKLNGKAQRISSEELAVVIPFTNGKELVEKFNQFFYGDSSPSPTATNDLASINSQISLRQSNLLLFERNYLNLNVDLRTLGAIDNQGKIAVTPDSLANLTFQIDAPWIARSLKGSDRLTPLKKTPGKLIWQLQPGQINHIEAVVWLVSPLGIGTAVVIVLMIAGFYLKYRHFPGIDTKETQSV